MTSVIVWQDYELAEFLPGKQQLWSRDLWIAADARISSLSSQSGGQRILTDAAPKILPIRYALYHRHEYGPGISHVWDGELGFAYAGPTLPATMTYALSVSSLARLTSDHDEELPRLTDFVEYIATAAVRYARETSSPFEFLLTGSCPRDPHTAQVWRVRAWSDGKEPGIERLEFDAERRFYLLGNRQAEIAAVLREGFADNVSYHPANALGQFINATETNEIGGYLQIARVEKEGGITLFPPAWAYGGDPSLPPRFDEAVYGPVGRYEVGLNRGF